MKKVEFNDELYYAIDSKGVAIINKNDKRSIFLEYPDAAIFCILLEHNRVSISRQMLQAILGKSRAETDQYLNNCLEKWKTQKIIREDG
jgi:hypothetical protein